VKLFLTAVLCAASALLCAAGVSTMSKDADAIRKALKTKQPAFNRIGYTLRLRELEGSLTINNYKEFEKAVLAIGSELKIAPADIEDTKVVLPFMNGRFAIDAFHAAHKISHPYELRFILRPQMYTPVQKVLPTHLDRYMRVLYLLKWNAARYHSWGGRCTVVVQALEYMDKCARAGKIERYKSDLMQLKAVFGRWKAQRPAQWQPVYDWIDNKTK